MEIILGCLTHSYRHLLWVVLSTENAKKYVIMPSATTQMDLELIILSTISQRQKSYDIIYMGTIKR